MTDRERFEVVLNELGFLLDRIGDLCEVVLIGGQVLAVEQLAAGEDPVLKVETDTGQTVERGYSFEPDLLIEHPDPDESPRWDEFPHILREAGYHRTQRTYRWEKEVGEVQVLIDLFKPHPGLQTATEMTALPRGETVLARAKTVRLQVGHRALAVKTPSSVDFILMKLDATKIRRPPDSKDAFDLYAYVRRRTATAVGRSLGAAPERDECLDRLLELFGTGHSPGVLDVLKYAPTLGPIEQELLAKDVVTVFRDVRAATSSAS
jgi:hypothetical protein